MRMLLSLLATLVACLPVFAADPHPGPREISPSTALTTAFLNLDLDSAGRQSGKILSHDPGNALALFVRMETAELEVQDDVVLDSALRLCAQEIPDNVANVASRRILEHAANSRIFHAVIPRLERVVERRNACFFNLRMALVSAAVDGDSSLVLDRSAIAAGVLTRWRIVGPFGHYSNADFDHLWPPESDRFSHSRYGILDSEEFRWRDGWISLPDYFPPAGIFYAASEFEQAPVEDALLHVFSSGPYSVFIDGKPVLLHDSRFWAGSNQASMSLKLKTGKHQVMIKLTSDALPMRVAIHPVHNSGASKVSSGLEPLHHYMDEMNAYLDGNLRALARVTRTDSSRASQYLRALLESSVAGRSSRARTAWQAVAPVPLARIKVAELSVDAGQTATEFRQEVSELTAALPDSEAAQQLTFNVLRTKESLQRLLELHASCSNLAKAVRFFSTRGEQNPAQSLEKQVESCAPESLLYPEILSAAGRHSAAAEYLLSLLNANGLNRRARCMLIQELLLANSGGPSTATPREEEARKQAEILHEIAPNSTGFAQIAADPYRVLDANSSRARGFVQQDQFYVPYRHSPFQIIRKSAERQFVGGPAVALLSDKVVNVAPDGAVSVYIHRITRLLNKDGIARYGEVAIPPGTDLLELRTIKADGQAIEPELASQKSSISMSALEAGDSMEEEFVMHYHDWTEAPGDVFGFTFGSFTEPILSSHFVVIAPISIPLNVFEHNDCPHARVEKSETTVIRVWERSDVAQTAWETDLPPETQLPSLTVAVAENSLVRLRDELIAATAIGSEVEKVSANLTASGKTQYEKARQIYHFVTSRIQSADAAWSANSAEDTLLNLEGSRTAALLSLGRAMGLRARLILARKVGQSCHAHDLNCYDAPLVRFWFDDDKAVDVDVESSDLPFGVVPWEINAEDALFAPVTAEDEAHPLHVPLVRRSEDEKSVAQGELFLNENGTMAADLHVRLGAARGREVRNLLRQARGREQQIFFDQLAVRIFPGAVAVRGSAANADDWEEPLELTLHCEVPQPMHPNTPVELDQLVPALGLHDLYANTIARHFPLYIATVLFESATFHLHLAPGLKLLALPGDFAGNSEFGNYSVRFSSSEHQVEIHREFRIPVQIIPPEKYAKFAAFARQIDEAERGRIRLEARSTNSARSN